MYPLPEAELAAHYPRTLDYLMSMRDVLRDRNGFAGWEKTIHRDFFYTLQRVGEYTFAPFKVCWKYIARTFTVCVLEHDDKGKVVLPNDKVMFIPLYDRCAAYFVGGLLSSRPFREYVDSIIEKRQISTSVIKSLALPRYNRECMLHARISRSCEEGHKRLRCSPPQDVAELRSQIDSDVAGLFKL